MKRLWRWLVSLFRRAPRVARPAPAPIAVQPVPRIVPTVRRKPTPATVAGIRAELAANPTVNRIQHRGSGVVFARERQTEREEFPGLSGRQLVHARKAKRREERERDKAA